ncbi:MAG: hypothetical protein MZV70_09030 [Desulfobacterales bacterium]|nr:hypothetical protein [Desulfobacterales bacterium]
MTAYSSVETAVDALKQGAHDYLTKPLDFDKLKITIERAMEHTRLKEENRRLRESLGLRFDRSRIIGQSPAMVQAAGHGVPGGAVRGHRADHGRIRHRQGADRRRHPFQQPAPRRPLRAA